jgi:outer membrane receptor protein involved in Fe transport
LVKFHHYLKLKDSPFMKYQFIQVSVLSLLTFSVAYAEDKTEKLGTVQLEAMSIVNTTPLGGGISRDKISANVQVMTADDLAKSQNLSVAEYMNKYMGSVTINDAQNNPMQPDIQYRGFTVSPLMGLSQGLSVYMNGIRFNEPFGDTVHWDLIPKGAIESMSLQSGSNPAYGLNSLGGAIAMQTKTGFTAPEHTLTVSGGSWGRHNEEITSGWNNDKFAYFLDLQHFQEDGWRDHSPSQVFNGLGTLSWSTGSGQLNLTLAGADSSLVGNGAIPVELEAIDRKAIFTKPDKTSNEFFLAALDGNLWLNDKTELTSNIYYRQNKVSTLNGDGSELEECDDGIGLCEEGEDEKVTDINGDIISVTDDVEGGTLNTSESDQWSFGFALQSAFNQSVLGHENHFIIGTSYDLGDVAFQADTELGSLTDERGVNGAGVFTEESRVRLSSKTHSIGLFFSEYLNITDKLVVNFSGRYNHVEIDMQDVDGNNPKLTGKHKFDRFNPATGFTYAWMPELNVYGGYSESSRVPTPMELSCADENDPCKLPNAFIADPPLEQVVSKTWEAGLRGNFSQVFSGNVRWNAGYFNTVSHDDILFQSTGNGNSAGFFENVGKTKRQGVELGLASTFFNRWRMSANYSFIDATYLTPFTVQSANHPNADANGDMQVLAGNHIPGIPRHIVKFSTDFDVIDEWTIGMNLLFNGEQFLRGDEANLDTQLSAYAVVNLTTEYRFNEHFTIFGRLDNLFGKQYNNFGLYGEADEVFDGMDDTRFVGVSAPRAGWVGVKLKL